ncbi:MAG: hypothetical protein AB1665_04615 [Candidatus Thermoplasmatota archaeon]
MNGEDLKEELKELSKRIQRLEKVLLDSTLPYSGLLEQMERFQELSRSYFRLIWMYQKHGRLSPEMAVPGLKDPITKDLLGLVMEKGPVNISEATELLREMRGRASRRIVRERLQDLEERGAIVSERRGKQRRYKVSEEVVNRWLEMLGLIKRKERT